VFVVYFFIDSVRKLLDTPSYISFFFFCTIGRFKKSGEVQLEFQVKWQYEPKIQFCQHLTGHTFDSTENQIALITEHNNLRWNNL